MKNEKENEKRMSLRDNKICYRVEGRLDTQIRCEWGLSGKQVTALQ